MEVETQLQIAENLGYPQKILASELLAFCAEVGRIPKRSSVNGVEAGGNGGARLKAGRWWLAAVLRDANY